jgi:hypothetical protein
LYSVLRARTRNVTALMRVGQDQIVEAVRPPTC